MPDKQPSAALDAAVSAAEARYIDANPTSRMRHASACRSMPGGNTRSVLHYSPFPLSIERGEGSSLWDADDHRYTDFLGEYTAGLYGHSDPVILAAIRGALDGGLVLGAPNRYENELARLLCARFPCCELVRFTNSGTEANLMAIGAARAATGRDRIMVFEGSYHGGVLSFAHGDTPLNTPFSFVFGRYNDLRTTLERLRPVAGELAAILVEPMMGAGGAIPGDPAFLQGLRDAASEHGIVLIFDEVMTSRLSGGGLQRHLGITPDLSSFGKYLGGGLSFGAFGGREALMAAFDPRRPDALPHAGTFNNNVLSMAAGTAGLGEVFTEDAAAALNARGDRLRQRLQSIAALHEVPLQVTGIGSIMSLHCQAAPIKRPRDTQATPARVRELLHLELIARGYIIARRGFMSLSLAVSDAELDGFAAALEDLLVTHSAVLRES